MLYQEQVMQVAQRFAVVFLAWEKLWYFTSAMAKNAAEMHKMEDDFVAGCS